MKIENLKINISVKNYKEMCTLLGEEIKTGNAKKAQLKEWERYFRWNKDGQKFIIDEIYEEIKPIVDNRKGNSGGANNTIEYTKNIETLILNLLSQGNQGYGKVFLSKNKILRELKMINGNFAYCKQRIPKLSKFMNIDKATVEEWYDSTNDMLERSLETSLKSLEKQSLILWSREITVVIATSFSDIIKTNNITKIKKIDQYDEEIIEYKCDDSVVLSHREGTEEEKKFIIYTEREILKELNCKDKSQVISMGIWDTFINKVNDILLKEYSIAYYYKSYKILFNEDHIYEVIEDLCDFALDESNEKQEQYILNQGVNHRIHNNLIKKQNKAQKEIDKISFGVTNNSKLLRRTAKNYIEDNDKLNDNLIIIEAKDIKKKVKQQTLK